MLRQINKVNWFIKFDVFAVFYKIKIREEDEWKIVFRI